MNRKKIYNKGDTLLGFLLFLCIVFLLLVVINLSCTNARKDADLNNNNQSYKVTVYPLTSLPIVYITDGRLENQGNFILFKVNKHEVYISSSSTIIIEER
jgi:hypothetical protein